MKTFEEVFEAVKERKKRVVLVGSEDKESIIALNEARSE
ncbi:MAG: phosphate butyryltransferase, partial [Mesoaciditoga sp.]